jgi:predicted Zn-dependent peptidase
MRFALLGLLAAMALPFAQSQDLKSFEQKITTKVLPNGLTLIICERPEAPVFSYATFIDAGDVNDPSGQSGLAHMFEHLAFKGTSQIGTRDYAAEKLALAKVEAANDAYEAEFLKAVGRDPKKLAELKKAFLDAQVEAHQYVIPNQFTDVAERNGAAGVNASTGLDDTVYFWSMPENRLELWAWLESGRLRPQPTWPTTTAAAASAGPARSVRSTLPRPWNSTRSITWEPTSWSPWWAT